MDHIQGADVAAEPAAGPYGAADAEQTGGEQGEVQGAEEGLLNGAW